MYNDSHTQRTTSGRGVVHPCPSFVNTTDNRKATIMTQQTTGNRKQATETYIGKAYKNKVSFVKACAKAIADLTGEYPEDELTCIYDRFDGRELGEILDVDGKFAYSDSSISLDFNIDSHIYVYVPEE